MHHKKCILKVVSLRTNIYFDKKKNAYYNKKGIELMTADAIKNYYTVDDDPPFQHSKFKNKESVTVSAFNNECKMQQTAAEHDIAPKIFAFGVHNTKNISYGLIIMEKMDCTLKELLRCVYNIVPTEIHNPNPLITNAIIKLHEIGLYHGDISFANIGINVHHSTLVIKSCKLLDFYFAGNLTSENREKKTKQDLHKLIMQLSI
jgi:tRNA A-37 threonylcarbamoyl transferase component Bud32